MHWLFIVILSILLVWAVASWYTFECVASLPTDGRLPSVEVDRDAYGGKWYEIASIPQWFQRGCVNVTAEYSKLGSENIRIVNTCGSLESLSEFRQARAVARATREPGQFGVSFFPPFVYGSYKVIYFHDGVAIVTDTRKSTLWILSRCNYLESDRYRQLLDWIETWVYDLAQLQRSTWTF